MISIIILLFWFSQSLHEARRLIRMNADPRIKIAVADDHDMFKEAIEIVLRVFPDMNLMIKASNGMDLLKQIKMNEPDIVLLDLQMPVMDGLSTLEELKRLHYRIKVIILSMDPDSVQEALRMGADGYLLKTTDPKKIANAIRVACNLAAFEDHSANVII